MELRFTSFPKSNQEVLAELNQNAAESIQTAKNTENSLSLQIKRRQDNLFNQLMLNFVPLYANVT